MNDFDVKLKNRWKIWCYDKDRNLKWTATMNNLVVTEGRNLLLDNSFTAAASAVTWYVGLITGPGASNTYAAADLLDSHTGWSECLVYTGDRKAWTRNGAASSGAMSNSSSIASFAINGSATVAGAFMCSAATGTSGQLYGEGNFSEGDQSVVSTDTIEVQADLSVSAS